jgi:quercetin dioxygenase-like cupin family protein
MLLSPIVVVLLGVMTLAAQPAAIAQEASPAAEESMMEEGIGFEALAFATALALPSTGELSITRVSFEPGTGLPIEEGDPSYALGVIESGELTIVQNAPLMVTRAGALDAAMGEAEASGAFLPETEEIAAGQEVTVAAGDAVLFPPNASGEIRNDGDEPAVVLVVFVGPPLMEGTAAGTPVP